jgi:hypothetical protein
MIIISHRGNLDGRIPDRENTVSYVDEALAKGFDVEIDVRFRDEKLWMGHDYPDEKIDMEWLDANRKKLWVHCKDLESILYLRRIPLGVHYFGHANDPFVLTSRGFLFCIPREDLTETCVMVMPEHFNFTPLPSNRAGAILTDFPDTYGEEK